MPAQNSFRLEQENCFVQRVTHVLTVSSEANSEHSENGFLPDRDARRLRIGEFALQDAQLVA
jgi:hypothetical protein